MVLEGIFTPRSGVIVTLIERSAAPYPSVESVKTLLKGQMILAHRNGNAIMYPNGLKSDIPVVGHMSEKYGKFAYSSKYGFQYVKQITASKTWPPIVSLYSRLAASFSGGV